VVVGIIDQFRLAVAGVQAGEDEGPAGLPIRLSRACVRVLPVVGAGLGLFSDPTMRIPVGASDDTAATAERLQFTVAEGPCFHAHRTGQPVVATETVIADRWPLFHDQLVTRTPIRGILSMPLGDGFSGVGVLDLYCHRSADVWHIDLDRHHRILRHHQHEGHRATGPHRAPRSNNAGGERPLSCVADLPSAEPIETNGRRMAKGACPVCGTK
jgi:hypothetical protein